MVWACRLSEIRRQPDADRSYRRRRFARNSTATGAIFVAADVSCAGTRDPIPCESPAMTRANPIPSPGPDFSGATAPAPSYQLKITIAGIKPAIWRRVLVAGSCTLHALHQIIQEVFGWSDSH